MDSVTTFLNSSGKSFVDFAVVMLVQSSLLIIVLLGLELILRKRVRAVLRYWLWTLILVKLMLPTTLSAPTGLAYWIGDKLPGILQQKSSTGEESGITSAGLESLEVMPIREVRVFASPTSGINPPPEAVSFVEAGAAGGLSITWQAVVFLTWLAAVITMTLLLIQRIFFVRGLVVQSKKASDEMVDMLQRCREQLGLGRPVRLKLSPVAASPSICGLFRPTILVPQALADRLDARQLKSILLHELAHIKRRDLLVSFVQTVLQIIYIYNPLLWVANAIIRKVREEAVDEMVLVAMGEQAEDYPQTLLSVSKLAFSRPPLSLRLIGVAESKKALISRIEYIASRPFPKKAKTGITGLIAVAVVAAILLPMAKAEKIDAETEVEQAWGEAVDGLRCRWFGAVKEVRAGAAAVVGMEIENVLDENIFWQCREGTWLIRHPRAERESGVGISPRFEVSLGEGVRKATREEAQPRHEGSGSAIGYYVLEPGARMVITAAYPYPLVESGPVEVGGFLYRENPGGGGGYFVARRLGNVMTCPPLVLEVVGGIKKPVIEGLSVSVACEEQRVKTADELGLVVTVENKSGGEVELDCGGLADAFPIVVLDMASQESGPHFLCTKEGGWYGTGRVRKALKNNENKSKTIHVSDCWRLYGGRPILSPGRYRVIAKVGRITPEGTLVEAESQPIWVTISEWPWGEALEGVRVRLRADKAMFEAGEPVILKADIYNGGTSEVFGQQTKHGICRLQFDNQLYAWGGGPVLGPPIAPGGQVNDIPIPLDNVWVGESKLNLSPGKHVMRVYFVGPQGKDDGGLSVLVVSNPVEITIIADEGAGESGAARAIGVSPATIGVYKQLDEIVELSGWKPEMSFEDAIEELKNSVEPVLKIVVLWSDLAENADIEQNTQTNLGPLPPVRLSFGLELLLKSVSGGKVELGYIVGDGVITIATVDSLPSKLETRVYDIALLVGPPLPGGYGGGFYGQPGGHKASAEDVARKAARANELAKLIQETIEPDSWCGASGEGEIQIYENRKLIVYQTREVHQKIEKLLGNMMRPGPGGAGIAYPKEFPYPVPWWQAVRAGEPNSAVQIESRFILVAPDANEIGELLQEVEDFEIAPLWAEPNVKHYLLEGEEGGQLFKKLTEGDPNCGMTAVPKVTVLSGESAAMSIQTQTVIAAPPPIISKIIPKAGAKCRTFSPTIPSGITLNVTPIITADKENILLNLSIQMSNFLGMGTYTIEVPAPDGGVAEYEREVPQIETMSVQTRVSIPNGATLLLAGQKVKSQNEQDGTIAEKELLVFIKAEIVELDANAVKPAYRFGGGFGRYGGGYGGSYGPGRYGGYGGYGAGYGGGYGGGFGAYPAVPPVIIKESDSPDVNSPARRRFGR